MQSQTQPVQHTLTIDNKKLLTATAIEGVVSFSPVRLTLTYAGGKITVEGSDMKITSFSKQTGAFSAGGTILSVRYLSSGGGLKKKLLK